MLRSDLATPVLPAAPAVPPPAPAASVGFSERALLAALADLGHSAFRPGQRQIVESVLAGSATVAIMPTGGGKSLCYQLPALLLPGVTLVVSPLIALMRDQVMALTRHGIRATFVNSTLSQGEREERQHNLHTYQIVYVAPERFRSPRFCEALRRVSLGLLAVDEAHCISEWGHDFRPEYRRLGEIIQQLAPARLLALTATATPEVRKDIVTQLKLAAPRVFIHGFDRPNLDFHVERAGGDKDKIARAAKLISLVSGGVIIVYTATRKKAVAVAEGLQAVFGRMGLDGKQVVAARPYHAGLPDEERRQTEKAFLEEDLRIIVATNAFGMGIDKRDVRLVIHYDLPRSPEAYYQEAGRAGRDGQRARCVLLFNPGDARVQEFLIEQSNPDPHTLRRVYEQVEDLGPLSGDAVRNSMPGQSGLMIDAALRVLDRSGAIVDEDGNGYRVAGPLQWDAQALAERVEREMQKLKRMLSYGYSSTCRMRFFLDYFGDHFREQDGTRAPRTRCAFCDNCRQQLLAAPLTDDGQLIVRKALAAVARIDGRFGKQRVAKVLHGSDDKDMRADLKQLSTFGILSNWPVEWLEKLLDAMEAAELVETVGEYRTVRLLKLGKEVMHDRVRAQLALPNAVTRKAAPAPPVKREPRITRPVRSTGAQRLNPSLPAPTPPAAGRGARADATDDDLPLTELEEQRFERLRLCRTQLAREAKMPPYVIFHDRTLRAIARACPANQDALGRVSGVGPAKLERYGGKMLLALKGT